MELSEKLMQVKYVGSSALGPPLLPRRPNFRPNNSKQTPKKYILTGKNCWPENGRFCPKVAEIRLKYCAQQFIEEIPSFMQFFSCLFINKGGKYVNQKQFT
jgi:hypothetical protein